MSQQRTHIVVREPYSPQYRDPITLQAGDAVQVERSDPEFPEWYWCRRSNGKEGWVHVSFLSASAGTAVALKDYCARELDVVIGDRGTLLQLAGGWACVSLSDGRTGWVPEGVVEVGA